MDGFLKFSEAWAETFGNFLKLSEEWKAAEGGSDQTGSAL
jgi:hypothetical protein